MSHRRGKEPGRRPAFPDYFFFALAWGWTAAGFVLGRLLYRIRTKLLLSGLFIAVVPGKAQPGRAAAATGRRCEAMEWARYFGGAASAALPRFEYRSLILVQ